MKSMTAFGRGEAAFSGGTVTVEIRSVNNRHLDCGVRMPRALSALEPRVKPYLQHAGVLRGKVDVSVTVDFDGGEEGALALDRELAAEYIAALRALRDGFGLRDDISVMSVAARPDLFVREVREIDPEELWGYIAAALATATKAFLAGREAEGERLTDDIRAKLAHVRECLARIEATSAAGVENYRERLLARMKAVLSDLGKTPDEGRLLTECALHADRVAIDEELVRLSSHIASFDEIAAGEGAGRRLDFLLQEMNREANTIGSKCADAAVALEVVEIKCTLEKIREQVQNIE